MPADFSGKLKFPENRNQKGRQQPENNVERSADFDEIEKFILSRSVNHRVCLVADRRHKTRRRGKDHRHQKRLRIHAQGRGGRNRNRGEQSSGRVVRHRRSQNYRQ